MSKLKKFFSTGVIITLSVVAVLIITIAVLACVSVNNFKKLPKPEFVQIYNKGSSSVSGLSTSQETEIKSAMNAMDFTIMHAILEWKWNYNFKFVTEKNEDGDTVRSEYNADEISALTADDNNYMVIYNYSLAEINEGVINYDSLQSLKVEGETVYFDRLKILVPNTNTNVGLVTIIPYINFRTSNQSNDPDLSSDTYVVNPITVRADTTRTVRVFDSVLTNSNTDSEEA